MFNEFDDVFNLKILYAVIGCLVVAGIVLILSAGLSFYNEFTKSSYVILGSVGLYISNAFACEYTLMFVNILSFWNGKFASLHYQVANEINRLCTFVSSKDLPNMKTFVIGFP